jgi:AcrR family transcriptional regulator
VTTDYSGGGDPARSLPLLWRDHKRPTRGPRPGLTVDRVVAAAIELADAEGLGALSMRRVADRLGVGTMSLSTYVPGKAELLDLMLDVVLAEEARPGADAGWRAGLELRAREDWALYHRHPWILQISPGRALLGPNETALFESTLRAVEGIGLSGSEMVLVVSLVAEYTRGAAQSAVGAAQAERRTGISDEQWWKAREPLFDKYFDPAATRPSPGWPSRGRSSSRPPTRSTPWPWPVRASSSACPGSWTARRSWPPAPPSRPPGARAASGPGCPGCGRPRRTGGRPRRRWPRSRCGSAAPGRRGR